MCSFFSSIYTIDDQILFLRLSHSHEDIIGFYDLKDNGKSFVRGEFTSDTLWDIDTYKFILDDDKPDWLTDEKIERWKEWCYNQVKSRIILSDRKLLIDDTYIIKDCKVNKIINCIVKSISDNAQVKSISGNAQVKSIYNNAQVKSIYDNAKIINDKRSK